MFDKFNVSHLISDLISNFVVDLLNVTLDLSMQFDFEHVFWNSIFDSCEIFNHLISIIDFNIVLFDNLIVLFDELFDDSKWINSNFSSSNFTAFWLAHENIF